MCLLDNCFAKSLTNNKGKTYHSFIGHSLDVAACMQTILQKNLFTLQELVIFLFILFIKGFSLNYEMIQVNKFSSKSAFPKSLLTIQQLAYHFK